MAKFLDLDGLTRLVTKVKDYVTSAVAGVTIDETNLVHKSGTETVTGAKTFSAPVTVNSTGNNTLGATDFTGAVTVQDPTADVNPATKSYVDGAVTAAKSRANHTGTQDANTITNLAPHVRNTILTGLSTATNAVITDSDILLDAFGKLQRQITDNLTTLTSHSANKNNPHGVTAGQVGAIPAAQKGQAGGVADLDSSGRVPTTQLPSYVDDVLEYANAAAFPATGESGKIYIAQDTNLTYRWSGSAYVEISPSLALGETSATAYRGDRGKTAYDHSQTAHAPATAQKNSDITKAEIEAKLTGAIATHSHTSVSGNAETATKLATARTIALGTDATGSISFDGSANVTIPVTVNVVTTADIDGLFV